MIDIFEHGDFVHLKGSVDIFRYNGYDESIESIQDDEIALKAEYYPDGQHQFTEDFDIMEIIRKGVTIWKIERDEDVRNYREIFSY